MLTNPIIPDAAARAIANLNRERAKHAERVGVMAEWGGGSEESFVRELMFKHTLGAKDPSMKAVEEIGMRLFKEQRKRKIAPLSAAKPGPLDDAAKLLRLTGGGAPVALEDRHCHWCKEKGHMIADCPAMASGAPQIDGPTPNWRPQLRRGLPP